MTHLTPQVLLAVLLGIALGHFFPKWGEQMEPLSKGFISLVKMVIGPVVFLTVSLGVASMGDLKRLGRVGGKTLLYFEIVTTAALLIGLLVVNLMQPGAGRDPEEMIQKMTGGDPAKRAEYEKKLKGLLESSAKQTGSQHALELIIPDSFVAPFVEGKTLQVVFVALLTGLALAGMGSTAKPIVELFERLSKMFFGIVGIVMRVAPIGAFAAMAYTVGISGIDTLQLLLKLMGCVYLTMALFIFIVLGTICRLSGFSLLRFLAYIRDEIMLVLGTSSSESALPRLMAKLQRAGCSKDIVELVVPAGYSFNLDGTSIYLSMATIFIAQVYHVPLTLSDQLGILLLLMLTSKGAAGVTGAGFFVLASTISSTPIPVAGVGLLMGVDRFMSEARSITNLIGNGVATMVIAKSEGEFDQQRWQRTLAGLHAELDVPDLPLEPAPVIKSDS